MAINKKLIHFLKLADFEARLANNEILDSSIVFIKDAKKIWTHGSYYESGAVDLTDIENSILNILDNKQDNLVSGTNIKTINGESLLGSGNIAISGSFTGANVQAVDTEDVVDDVDVSYATKAYVDGLVGNINSTIGDINSVLESIIGSNENTTYDFWIDDLAFLFNNGMTFDEWLDSEYNSFGYIKEQISDDVYRVANSAGNFISYNGVWVVSTDTIVKDGSYKTGL